MFFLLLLFSLFQITIKAACPDMKFYCPTGRTFNAGSCWDWWEWECEICSPLWPQAIRRCGNPGCSSTYFTSQVNGCGPKAWRLPVSVSKALSFGFTDACNIHDICYSTPGATQKYCDDSFYTNMVHLCDVVGVNIASTAACVAIAKGFQTGVRLFGSSSYNNGQRWARSHCRRRENDNIMAKEMSSVMLSLSADIKALEEKLAKKFNLKSFADFDEFLKTKSEKEIEDAMVDVMKKLDKYVMDEENEEKKEEKVEKEVKEAKEEKLEQQENIGVDVNEVHSNWNQLMITGLVGMLLLSGFVSYYYCYYKKINNASMLSFESNEYGSM